MTLTHGRSKELQAQLKAASGDLRWCVQSESARRGNAALDLARSQKGVPVLPTELDRDPTLLNCPNGMLDLRTGWLREHRREDYITKLCPTPFDEDAACPAWEWFLEAVFDGDRELI